MRIPAKRRRNRGEGRQFAARISRAELVGRAVNAALAVAATIILTVTGATGGWTLTTTWIIPEWIGSATVTVPGWILLPTVAGIVMWAPTSYLRRRYVRQIYQRTRTITRDEEYEADRAQNRRHWLRLLRGAFGRHMVGAYFEPMRRPARPGKYVRVRFRPDAPWCPQRHHIAAIQRRWPPIFEANAPHGQGVDKLQRQIEGYLGGRPLDMDLSLAHCRATFTPATDKASETGRDAAVTKLPARLLYPADTPHEEAS